MMDAKQSELAQRRARLVAKATQQRRALATIHEDLQGPIAALMTGLRVAGSMRGHRRRAGISALTTLLAAGLRFAPLRTWWTRGRALYRGGKALYAMLRRG